MCITLRPGIHCRRPYNKNNIRYKVMKLRVDMFGRRGLAPLYQHEYEAIKIEEWLQAEQRRSDALPQDIGFHVYIEKGVAKDVLHQVDGRYDKVLVEVEVTEFNRAGKFLGDKCETWGRMKIHKVWNRDGRNITYRLRKKK